MAFKNKLGDKVVGRKIDWGKILDLYFERHSDKRHSQLTVTKYEQVLRDLFLFVGEDVTRNGIKDYRDSLSIEGRLRIISINKTLTILRSFFSWASANGLISLNPMVGIQNLREGKRLRTVLRKDQIEALYKEAEKDPVVMGQDLVMFDVFYGTGIRTNELCQIDIPDIDFETNCIKIRFAKGGSERIVAMPTRVSMHLRSYLIGIQIRFPVSDVAFPNRLGNRINPRYVYERIQRILSKLLSEKKGAHTLRHSFATVMIDEGAPMPAVQRQLGHKSAATTQIYDHTAVERLKKVHRQAHPKGGHITSE